MSEEFVKVLYVEDDESDVEIAHMALKDIGCQNFKLEVIEDGEQALQYLIGKNEASHFPDMILLDLNLPKVHGREILKTIKDSDVLKRIPVVVLSTSSQQNEIDEIYRLGASGYFTKPIGYEGYKNTFRAICDYWIHKASLPSRAVNSNGHSTKSLN